MLTFFEDVDYALVRYLLCHLGQPMDWGEGAEGRRGKRKGDGQTDEGMQTYSRFLSSELECGHLLEKLFTFPWDIGFLIEDSLGIEGKGRKKEGERGGLNLMDRQEESKLTVDFCRLNSKVDTCRRSCFRSREILVSSSGAVEVDSLCKKIIRKLKISPQL